jgi:hypothetical protein
MLLLLENDSLPVRRLSYLMAGRLNMAERYPNAYKLRCMALTMQAEALAANLWWAVNDGWAAVDGGSLAEGQIIEYQGSRKSSGRFEYKNHIKIKHPDFDVCTICLEMDVFSGEYTDALYRLESWELEAVREYLKRQPVAALQRAHFERKNPDRHKEIGAPLYLTSPDLQESIYQVQRSAFMALAGWLLDPPRVCLIPKI